MVNCVCILPYGLSGEALGAPQGGPQSSPESRAVLEGHGSVSGPLQGGPGESWGVLDRG